MRERKRRSGNGGEADVLKGLTAGLVGGLVAAAVMNGFQSLVGKLVAGGERSHGAQSLQQGSPRGGVAGELRERGSEDADDDATERLASAVAEGVFDHRLTEREKDLAGVAVHYAFGATTGALYGAAAELLPGVAAGGGAPFGIAVWVTTDEGLVPLLGLSKPPTEYPPSIHAYAFASHLVYGLATEVVRRAVREMMNAK